MSQSISTMGHPPLEFSSDESDTLMSPSSMDSSMDASILEKLAEYIYDDESDTNVLRRVLYTGICTAFPKTAGGECGPIVSRQEMIKVDRERGFLCSSCQGTENIHTIDSILEERYPSILMDNKEKYESSSKKKKKSKNQKSKSKSSRKHEEEEEEDVAIAVSPDVTDYKSREKSVATRSKAGSKKIATNKSVHSHRQPTPQREPPQYQQRSPSVNNVDTPQTYSKMLSTPVKQTQYYNEASLQMVVSPHGKSELLKHDSAIEIRTSQLYEEELMYKEKQALLIDAKNDGKRGKKLFKSFIKKTTNSSPLRYRRKQ